VIVLLTTLGMIMTFTMRRESREEVGHRAWLDTGDGAPLVACTLVDISPSGAKLSVDEAGQIPDTFGLRLTRYGHPRFACRTVWRSSNMLGVTFAEAVNEVTGRA
jgi:PilZ domain-containing protein